MEIKKVTSPRYCVACDEALAAVEITHNGAFKLFWACAPSDGEICLCSTCFALLRAKMNTFEI